MSDVTGQASGWIINGFETILALGVWTTLVLLYGVIRSLNRPEPDPIRASGPIDA